MLTINFQKLDGKQAEFWSMINAVKPDIIFGSETWLVPNISTSEVFPPDYNVYRKDRGDGWGGVLLAIHSSLTSYQLPVNTEAEFVSLLKLSVIKPTW